ncbi:TRAP transporter small permease subunit [Mesorhizobium sp. M4B.F.Ca.ET.089.01.1.1]|uniref:TRAP transporter small permease n=2 Tax=unclassified Mesorhizobium TaxID=325217 RepID=UPI000FE2F4CB|nr:TRAP transporter small permease subunit [Mesorhizobium sp. M4B.F.Ca.ET.089.01.1.1]RWX58899.1 TRAP transporter small permease subunit [Mesorhizobium sp. M4B.F.Ca.ET.089.01.1.1]
MDQPLFIAHPVPLKGRGQRAFAFAGAIAFAIMFNSTLLSVVARFFGLSHFEWTFEVAAIAFVWVTFLGILVGEIRGENVSFDPVKDSFRPSVRHAIDGGIAICVLILGVVLLWSGLAVWQRFAFVPTPVLRLPQGITIASILVLGLALAGLGAARLVRVVKGEEPYPEREPVA